MIAEGSFDSENWSNDAENSDLASQKRNITFKYIGIFQIKQVHDTFTHLSCLILEDDLLECSGL